MPALCCEDFSVCPVSFLSQFSAVSSSSHLAKDLAESTPSAWGSWCTPRPFLHIRGAGTPIWKTPNQGDLPPPAQLSPSSQPLPGTAALVERSSCVLQHSGTLSSTQRHSNHGLFDFRCSQLSITFPGFPIFQPV